MTLYLFVNNIRIGRISQDKIHMMLLKQGLSWREIGNWLFDVTHNGHKEIIPGVAIRTEKDALGF